MIIVVQPLSLAVQQTLPDYWGEEKAIHFPFLYYPSMSIFYTLLRFKKGTNITPLVTPCRGDSSVDATQCCIAIPIWPTRAQRDQYVSITMYKYESMLICSYLVQRF